MGGGSSQVFKIIFASGDKGALTPLTKILRTPLFIVDVGDQMQTFLFSFMVKIQPSSTIKR